jgi:protein-arginine kinase activator protein McsA
MPKKRKGPYRCEEDKIDLTEDRVKDMLKFAVEREYYEKAAILRDFLKNKIKV